LSKPGGGYSSSRLDLSGENIGEMAKTIATTLPWLAWLHSGNALALYKDPYIQAILVDPIGTVSQVFYMKDPEGRNIGRQYLNALFSVELGRDLEDNLEDMAYIGGKLFTWLEQRITGYRVIEMIRYMSAADPTEKLITGSLIKEASDATDRNQAKDLEEIDTSDLGPIHEQVLELKKSHPELYEMLNRQLKQATVQAGPGIGYPLTPLSLPVLGETEAREEQLEEGLELEPEEDLEPGMSLREWTRARAKKTGIIEQLDRIRAKVHDFRESRGL